MSERTLSYRPGSWLGIVGANATVLLPGTEKARAGALWPLVDDGAGFDAVLDALVAGGLSSLPGFVLLSHAESGVRVLVRGEASATFETADGPVVVAADAGSMWSERTVVATDFAIALPDEPTDGATLAVSEGLVRLGALETPASGRGLAPVVKLAPVASPVDPGESGELAATDVDFLADEPDVPGVPGVVGVPGVPAAPTLPPPPVAPPSGLSLDAPHADAPEGDVADPTDDEDGDEADALALFDEDDDFGDAATEVHDALDEDLPDESDQPGDLGDDDDAATDDIPVIDASDPLGSPPSWIPDTPPPPAVPPAATLPPPPAAPPVGDPDAELTEALVAPTEAAESARPTTPPRPVAPSPHLSFSSGAEVDVDGLVVIGRRPDAGRFPPEDEPLLVAVPSPHSEISSTHLEVRPGTGDKAGLAVVTDLGSTNGTLVVQPGQKPEELRAGVGVALASGALIDLGDGLTIRVR